MEKIRISLYFFITLLLFSCHTSRNMTGKIAVSGKEIQETQTVYSSLNMSPAQGDYYPLYKECATWIGVPHRYGGTNKNGVDCSGLVMRIYKDVYGLRLSRSSGLIYRNDCKPISKKQLQEGDLVFFSTSKKEKINHVGIYLRNGYFIHTSSSRGVIVSRLDEAYYRHAWKGAGRVKR